MHARPAAREGRARASDSESAVNASPSPRRTRGRKVLAALGGLVAAVLAAEVGLRLFFPFHMSIVGHTEAPNAAVYGWGLAPGERLMTRDPDTGEVFPAYANRRGWRDRDRTFANATDAYRVLVLGDSVTFAPAVRPEHTFTQLTEARLREQGVRAEVINMAYAGWGTDQQLEALRTEGLRYEPDLVIVQFSTNDVQDIMNQSGLSAAKPFRYRLDDAGALVRESVAPRTPSPAPGWKGAALSLVKHSELLKRIYWVYFCAAIDGPVGAEGFVVNDDRLVHVRVALGLDEDAPLLESLRAHGAGPVAADRLAAILDRAGAGPAQRETVRRILEDRWFQDYWSPEDYRPEPPDPDSERWRLYRALLRRIGRLAREHGARVAVLSANEQGQYAWERYWRRVAATDRARANFLAPGRLVERIARDLGCGVVEPVRAYERARNDPHPNLAGNRAMADSLHAYLAEHHAADLAAHRDAPPAAP